MLLNLLFFDPAVAGGSIVVQDSIDSVTSGATFSSGWDGCWGRARLWFCVGLFFFFGGMMLLLAVVGLHADLDVFDARYAVLYRRRVRVGPCETVYANT